MKTPKQSFLLAYFTVQKYRFRVRNRNKKGVAHFKSRFLWFDFTVQVSKWTWPSSSVWESLSTNLPGMGNAYSNLQRYLEIDFEWYWEICLKTNHLNKKSVDCITFTRFLYFFHIVHVILIYNLDPWEYARFESFIRNIFNIIN